MVAAWALDTGQPKSQYRLDSVFMFISDCVSTNSGLDTFYRAFIFPTWIFVEVLWQGARRRSGVIQGAEERTVLRAVDVIAAIVVTAVGMATVRRRFRRLAVVAVIAVVANLATTKSRAGQELVRLCGTHPNKCKHSLRCAKT